APRMISVEPERMGPSAGSAQIPLGPKEIEKRREISPPAFHVNPRVVFFRTRLRRLPECHRALQNQPLMGASKPAAVQRYAFHPTLLIVASVRPQRQSLPQPFAVSCSVPSSPSGEQRRGTRPPRPQRPGRIRSLALPL